MANTPENWEHDNGYRLNADGKSIEYRHTENSNLLAIVEAMVNEQEDRLEYYTVIFDTSGGKPWKTIEPHQSYFEKDAAQNHLHELMEEHA